MTNEKRYIIGQSVEKEGKQYVYNGKELVRYGTNIELTLERIENKLDILLKNIGVNK